MKTEPAQRKAEPKDGKRQTVVTSLETSGLNKAWILWLCEPESSLLCLSQLDSSKQKGGWKDRAVIKHMIYVYKTLGLTLELCVPVPVPMPVPERARAGAQERQTD